MQGLLVNIEEPNRNRSNMQGLIVNIEELSQYEEAIREQEYGRAVSMGASSVRATRVRATSAAVGDYMELEYKFRLPLMSSSSKEKSRICKTI